MKQDFLEELRSRRKTLTLGQFRLLRVDLTPLEREKLYEIAESRNLLTKYEFSGVESSGTSRNDAASRLIEKTRKRAFDKLRIEFGAKARFWASPPQLSFLEIDFYWRLARIGVHIKGPLLDDLWSPFRERVRDRPARGTHDCEGWMPNYKGIAVLNIPYYVVWHNPSQFLSKIRQKLVESQQYPRLCGSVPNRNLSRD